MKTLGHRSDNRQEQMSKRTYVPKQGRSSLVGTNSVAASGPQLMGSGVASGPLLMGSGGATGSQLVVNSGGAGGSQQMLSLGGAGG